MAVSAPFRSLAAMTSSPLLRGESTPAHSTMTVPARVPGTTQLHSEFTDGYPAGSSTYATSAPTLSRLTSESQRSLGSFPKRQSRADVLRGMINQARDVLAALEDIGPSAIWADASVGVTFWDMRKAYHRYSSWRTSVGRFVRLERKTRPIKLVEEDLEQVFASIAVLVAASEDVGIDPSVILNEDDNRSLWDDATTLRSVLKQYHHTGTDAGKEKALRNVRYYAIRCYRAAKYLNNMQMPVAEWRERQDVMAELKLPCLDKTTMQRSLDRIAFLTAQVKNAIAALESSEVSTLANSKADDDQGTAESPPLGRRGWESYYNRDLSPHVVFTANTPSAYGAFSDVYQATLNDMSSAPPPHVAVKVIRCDKTNMAKTVQRLRRELVLWQMLDHPNILPIWGICFRGGDSELPSLVSPWCENGSITTYTSRLSGTADEVVHAKLNLLIDALQGLAYLHTLDAALVHGDLKGGNILVSSDGRAQLSDFGLASMDDLVTTNLTGTARWMSPELFTGETARATVASDIWAFGCVIVEVLSGRHPYFELENVQRVIIAITQGRKPSRPDDIDDELWAVIEGCWTNPPTDRPPAEFLLQCLRRIPNRQYLALSPTT